MNSVQSYQITAEGGLQSGIRERRFWENGNRVSICLFYWNDDRNALLQLDLRKRPRFSEVDLFRGNCGNGQGAHLARLALLVTIPLR
jgi:hypothetical protein